MNVSIRSYRFNRLKRGNISGAFLGVAEYLHVMLHNMLYEPGHRVVGPGDGNKRQKEVDSGAGRCCAVGGIVGN